MLESVKNLKFNVAERIKDLDDNIQRDVRVTEHNVATIYDYFCRNVIKNVKKIKSHNLVGIFMGVITNGDEYYQHPTKKNILVTPLGNIDINGDGFKSFFSYFQRNYTPQEKNNLTAIADRLIEDTDRRNNGDFWTPTLFVDYAHKMISEQLGEDWKEKFVVWDNCCGSKNLTRDYKFRELYCSTLFDSELKIGERYNKEAVSFQYDFLNDDLEKLPKGLLEAFEQNKPIVFFLNPPYATACNQGETSKNGINNTMVRKQMIVDNLGSGAENLQHQFMYRIMKIKNDFNLTNVHIAIFSKPIYLTGGKQANFLNVFCDNFHIVDGIIFNASNFADVSDKWGITFNIWKNGVSEDKNNFNHICVDCLDGEIISKGTKMLYNANKLVKASEWVRKPIKGVKMDTELPCMSNAIKIKESERAPFTNIDAIGYFHNNANSIQYNAQYVGMYATPFASANGVVVMRENFDRCTALFSARKLIVGNWINDKDEYLAPNTEHPAYNEFVNDSLIYSLFESKSNQSSLRNVDYKGKLWDVKNEFFWMSKEEIMDLANEYNMDDVYEDAKTSDERYVYKYIQEHKKEFSQEALDVLNKAIELTKKSFKYRQLFADEHPEYQLEKCWDAGFYQLKAIWKEYMKDDFEEFRKLYRVLSDKMRPMVYTLGFLKN